MKSHHEREISSVIEKRLDDQTTRRPYQVRNQYQSLAVRRATFRKNIKFIHLERRLLASRWIDLQKRIEKALIGREGIW